MVRRNDAFTSGLMWSVYNDMEGVFMDFLDYVPPQDQEEVYSYKLLRLMLQLGGYIDTAFKEMAFDSKFDGNAKCEEIRDKTTKEEIVTINDFREAFQPIYGLSSRTVFVKSPKRFRTIINRFNPFWEFKEGKTPIWWKAYNGVKHNWLKNFREANMKNTLKALGGAFLLNVTHEPSLFQLARMGIAKTSDTKWRQIRVGEKRLSRIIQRLDPAEGIALTMETQLFLWRFK